MGIYYNSSNGLRQFACLEWLWKVTEAVEGGAVFSGITGR